MGAFSDFVMSRPFQIEIKERQEELKKALKHATVAKKDYTLLYWLNSGEQQAIAPLVTPPTPPGNVSG